MKSLTEIQPNSKVSIAAIDGSVRLLTRLSSIGLVPGSTVEVVRNDRARPVLVYERDTLVAINREEAKHISVKEVA